MDGGTGLERRRGADVHEHRGDVGRLSLRPTHRNKGQFFAVDPRSGKVLWTTRGREGEERGPDRRRRSVDGDDDRGRAGDRAPRSRKVRRDQALHGRRVASLGVPGAGRPRPPRQGCGEAGLLGVLRRGLVVRVGGGVDEARRWDWDRGDGDGGNVVGGELAAVARAGDERHQQRKGRAPQVESDREHRVEGGDARPQRLDADHLGRAHLPQHRHGRRRW